MVALSPPMVALSSLQGGTVTPYDGSVTLYGDIVTSPWWHCHPSKVALSPPWYQCPPPMVALSPPMVTLSPPHGGSVPPRVPTYLLFCPLRARGGDIGVWGLRGDSGR